MNDKNFEVFAGIAALALLAWWLWNRRSAENVAQSAPDNAPVSPLDSVYASNPNAFGPQNINVNVTPNLPSYLSQSYFPLFGFVGMAQGETFQ